MARFENFKPRLKKGQIITEGQKVIFEAQRPFSQIILPIEACDLLSLCDGKRSIREIIEIIYKKNGSVHFKSLYNAILSLRDNDFFINGEDLNIPQTEFKKKRSVQDFLFSCFLEIFISKRIYNDKVFPFLFYLFSMSSVVLFIFQTQFLNINILNSSFLIKDGSLIKGVVLFYGISSLFLSLKNLFKLMLQIFLTGRAYNFSIRVCWYGTYFHIGADSMCLVRNRLFLFLFHFSVTVSYFSTFYILNLIFPDLVNYPQFFICALILTLSDLGPFHQSELSQLFNEFYEDEGLVKLSAFLNNTSLVSISKTSLKLGQKQIFRRFSMIALFWSLLAFLLSYVLIVAHIDPIANVFNNPNFMNKFLALCLIILFILISIMVTSHLSHTLILNFFAPIIVFFKKKYLKSQLQRLTNVDMKELSEVLYKLPLFSYFNKELLSVLLGKSAVRRYRPNSRVVYQGDKSDAVFVLLDGQVRVRRENSPGNYQNISDIYPISIFGENAVLEESPRAAEIVSTKTSTILSVPAQAIRQIAKESQFIREIETFKNIIMVNQFFSSAPIFRELPQEVVHLFLTKGKIEIYDSNRVVIRQGSRGDGFYLLIRGTVGVFINGRIVNKIKQGGFFGEIALIADVPRTATITTLEKTVLLKINTGTFWEILSQNIDVAMFIESVGKMRVKEDIDSIKKSSQDID